jgi:hypothetical protein
MSYADALKPFTDKLKLAVVCQMSVEFNSEAAKGMLEAIELVAERLDDRTVRRLDWTEMAQKIDIWSVWLSGLTLGLMIGWVL